MQQQLPSIVEAVLQHRALVLVAEPGSGKTTVVPWAIALALQQQNKRGQVLVLEPRRLAARMATTYVAATLGEQVGERIGYQVRHDSKVGTKTRLIYMTHGILWRMMMAAPELQNAACVVFDEFHDRSLAGDLLFAALVHRRQSTGLGPAIVVMSATLAHEAVTALLPEAKTIHVPGRHYPVEIEYLAAMGNSTLAARVAQGLAQVVQAHPAKPQGAGHILTFLPGKKDIAQTALACAALAQRHHLEVVPLHASLSPQQQALAVKASGKRRLILATNVAETSLTIAGVSHVIDSGLANLAQVDPLTGIMRLQTGAISQAAAIQRSGRAGRTGPGFCLRLYTAVNFLRRERYETPEILRQDLSEAVLWLAAQSLPPLSALQLLDRPDETSVAMAYTLLQRLGAWQDGHITAMGRSMLQLGLHPRLGAVVLAAHRRGLAAWGCRAAAVLSTGHILGTNSAAGEPTVGHSDLVPLCEEGKLDRESAQVAHGLQRTLQKLQRQGALAQPAEGPLEHVPERMDEALLWGFRDRLVRRLPPLGARMGPLNVALGWRGQGILSRHSCVRDSSLMLALGAGTRNEHSDVPVIDLAHGLEVETLLALGDGKLQETVVVAVSETHGRVEKVETLYYDQLLVHQARSPHVTASQAAHALEAWVDDHHHMLLERWRQSPGYGQLEARLEVVARGASCGPLMEGAVDTSPAGDGSVLQALYAAVLTIYRQACAQCRSVGELQQTSISTLLMQQLTRPWQDGLRNLAPTDVLLRSGRRLPVHYTQGQPPYVASYLQDFFGSNRGPTLGPHGPPLTMHLWGPNRQPLQVTCDLQNFWEVHYPKLRPALSRRYPRHVWPQEPASAQPTIQRPRKIGR